MGALLAGLVVLFSLKTLHRNAEWYDEERLFRAAQKVGRGAAGLGVSGGGCGWGVGWGACQ